MKAFLIERYGSNDRDHLGEMPEPTVGPDDVLIDIHAAGVNPLDLKIRDGALKMLLPFRLPVALGNEVSGIVSRVGAGVTRFRPGDEVYARADKLRIGGFAERLAVPESAVAPKPKSLTMVEAAAVPLAALTAWQVLVDRAGLKAGQKVLIHAGSGGVGTFAIQIAKHLGAFVATTTSAANTDFVTSLGADLVIDYRREDFSARLKDYDVVLDGLGAETVAKSLLVVKPGGQVIGLTAPPDPGVADVIEISPLLRLALHAISFKVRRAAKKRGVTYSFLFMRPDGAQLEKIGNLIDAGHLRVVVDKAFPFDATKDALAYVETGRAKGKVVVQVK